MGNNHVANHFTLDDIVFEGRNRAYGAYLLRKLYPTNLFKATLYATALFLLLLCIPIVQNLLRPAETFTPIVTTKPSHHLVEVKPITPVIPEEKPRVEEPAPPTQKVKSTQFTDPKVVANNQPVTTEFPDQDKLSKTNIGTETVTEGIDTPPPGIEAGNTSTTGSGTGTAPTEDFVYVEQMPSFGAGDAELLGYLAKNIRYPEKAQKMGVEGMVIVSFVIAPDGSVTKLNVVKGLGFGTEEEAIRVLKNMPKWKPGYQNGTAVPVKITL
ncbi:MAG: TonB family protein, partial [Hymenobacteraceae bacterium]|nr:TonB family protein [Hymenobacteraceae bacterium]MDX5395373.1 TonB family protein [Hymenobacteraceae bacterium]MDX5511424.1 TonB family protein [Hymenobacteraceae bacterium]